jgi:hypothetical protein
VSKPLWFVEVVARKGKKVVKCLGPMSDARAEKVARGVEINMNHDDYYTQVVFGPRAKTEAPK